MRKVFWKENNQYGDATFTFVKITPPDEEMARQKYLAEEPKKREERLAKASPKTLARIAEIKAKF